MTLLNPEAQNEEPIETEIPAEDGAEISDEERLEAAGLVPPNLEEQPGENPPADGGAMPVICAFIIYQDSNGRWTGNSDLTLKLAPSRVADLNDFFVGASVVQRDVNAVEFANRTIMTGQQMAMQAQQVQQNQQIIERLMKNPRGGPAPAPGALIKP